MNPKYKTNDEYRVAAQEEQRATFDAETNTVICPKCDGDTNKSEKDWTVSADGSHR